MSQIYEQIIELLISSEIEYVHKEHEETLTSEDSARARGEDISVGGKALVLKVGDEFHLFVMSAALKLDNKAIRKHLGSKKARFATPEELMKMCGLVPGSVPPFGKPILPFDLYIDTSIRKNEKIAFNAGSLTNSIIMKTEDYLSCCGFKEEFEFSK